MEKTYPTREQIEKADDRPFEDVPAPELGEGMWTRVQTMCAADRDSWEYLWTQAQEQGHELPGAHLLVRCLVDPTTGERMYRDAEFELLGRKGHHWQTRALAVAIRLNAIRKDSVETIAKN